MFRSFMKPRHTLAAAAILAAGSLLAGSPCRAAGDDVRPVATEKLPNVPGKSITAIVVNYAPGAKSVKHHHAGSVLDGDDQVWISNFAAPWGQLARLGGFRTEPCPPGMKTGDPISPPLGYVRGMRLLVDVDIDPAGNVWIGNNWQDAKQWVDTPVEALSTRCGGQGVVVFYGNGQAGSHAADRAGA